MYRHHQQKEDFLEKTFTDYLGCHPTYMIPLIRAHNFIMRDVGPINANTRYYIAILASSRHRCTFLVNFLKKQFLTYGGDAEWLKGVHFAPKKMQSLNSINKILAHQPWLLNKNHITNLTKSDASSWALPELTHAIVILAHFHSMCSLSFGCKFGFELPEVLEDDADYEEVEIEEIRFDGDDRKRITKVVKRSPASSLIVERCRQLIQEDANLAKVMTAFTTITKRRHEKYLARANERREQSQNENNSKSTNQSMPATPIINTQCMDLIGEFKINTWSEDEWKKNNYDVFIDDQEFCYVDFAKRTQLSEISTYRIQDYQWDDQGYSLSNYLYPDIAGFLDEKFKVGYNLTYYTLGPKTNVDTSPFRRAVWNYIQSIYGIRHDDYNYREVNILLERNLKSYIKYLGCFPENSMKRDFRSVMKGFRSSEKVHVIIMIAEARLQAELLYALRTLMNFMKQGI
ncbi:extensin-like [Sarcoptes scabiei]|nr:extensin-like [Sarcoptes scabiei]